MCPEGAGDGQQDEISGNSCLTLGMRRENINDGEGNIMMLVIPLPSR